MDCARVIFSQHAFTRMFARSISPEWVTRATKFGEVIADYPDDQPFPSCLLLYIEKEKALHVIVAKDEQNGDCHIITAYWPDTRLWEDDFRTRRT
jgi:hypothetical protein